MAKGLEQRFVRFVGVKKPDESFWKYRRWRPGIEDHKTGGKYTIFRLQYVSGIGLDTDLEEIRLSEFEEAVFPFTDEGEFSRDAFERATVEEKKLIVAKMQSVRNNFLFGSVWQSDLAVHFQNELDERIHILYLFNSISWVFPVALRRLKPVKRKKKLNDLPKI